MNSRFRRYGIGFALVCLFFPVTASSVVTEGPAKVGDPTVPSSLYRLRREKLMNRVGPASVAIFYSSPLRMRNGDTEYPYRQNDDFYYLTGLNVPGLVLVLCPSGKDREILLYEESPAG